MKTFEFGDVVLANVWREDMGGKKQRPCIIMEASVGHTYEVLPITSRQATEGARKANEVIIIDDAEKAAMGLWKDSRLCVSGREIRTVKAQEIARKIGKTTYPVLGRMAVASKR